MLHAIAKELKIVLPKLLEFSLALTSCIRSGDGLGCKSKFSAGPPFPILDSKDILGKVASWLIIFNNADESDVSRTTLLTDGWAEICLGYK